MLSLCTRRASTLYGESCRVQVFGPPRRLEPSGGVAQPGERSSVEEDTAVTERWLPVVSWEGYYEVSDLGRVRSVDRVVPYQGGSPRRIRSRILRQITDDFGRRRVTLAKHGRNYPVRVHHLVLTAFVGPCPQNMERCHGVGGNGDNRLCNLRYDSHSANMFDKQRDGTDHQLNKTHCNFDHRLVMPNLVPSLLRRGRRGCLACNRGRGNQYHAARLGRSFNFKTAADEHYDRIMKGFQVWSH